MCLSVLFFSILLHTYNLPSTVYSLQSTVHVDVEGKKKEKRKSPFFVARGDFLYCSFDVESLLWNDLSSYTQYSASVIRRYFILFYGVDVDVVG